jgi:hypothetical protein
VFHLTKKKDNSQHLELFFAKKKKEKKNSDSRDKGRDKQSFYKPRVYKNVV